MMYSCYTFVFVFTFIFQKPKGKRGTWVIENNIFSYLWIAPCSTGSNTNAEI